MSIHGFTPMTGEIPKVDPVALVIAQPQLAGVVLKDWKRTIVNWATSAITAVALAGLTYAATRIPILAPYVGPHAATWAATAGSVAGAYINGLLTRSPIDKAPLADVKEARANGDIQTPPKEK